MNLDGLPIAWQRNKAFTVRDDACEARLLKMLFRQLSGAVVILKRKTAEVRREWMLHREGDA